MAKKCIKGTLSIIFMIGIMCLTIGCSTTIPVTYTEPAKLNMSGVSRVAVKANDANVANNISQRLSSTGVYTIASAAELAEWEKWLPLGRLQATATEVSSTNLVSEYKANAVRASSNYGNKLLKISGTVAEIGQSSRGSFFARISVGNDAVAIYFAASELDKLASVDKGQVITIVGTNIGFNQPDMDDTAEILRLLGAGQRINIVNATFLAGDYPGKIDAIVTINKDTRAQESSSVQLRRVAVGKDDEGKTIYENRNVTVYERSVIVTIPYQVVRSRDSSMIGQGTKTATSSKSTNEDRSKLTSISQLESNTIGKPLQELANEIVPVQHTISLTLAKPDDSLTKNEMSAAQKLVKSKNYSEAVEAYGKIYANYNSFAAGYNQAILTEAADSTAKAITLMTALVQKFSDNPTAQKTLAEMRMREAANQQSLQQLSK